LQQHYQIKNTLYKIDNRSSKSKPVLIEFTPASGYATFDTPDPAEKTLNTHRYAVEAAPGQITTFTVKERTLRSQKEEIRSLKHKKLQAYFKDNFLDEQSYRKLEALLTAWDEISQLEKQINKQEKARQKIYTTQEQVQKNMQVLSNRGDEGRLRSRYVKQLAQSEEDLAKIAQTIKNLQTDIATKKAKIDKMMEALGR
jgi:membrane-bound lytic murein transglycosylase